MRRVLHFLVIVTVLMCALHIGEPAQAHDEAGLHQLVSDADAPADEGDGSDREANKAAHTAHHHCPMAPDQRIASDAAEISPDNAILFTRPIAALKSLSQAPPVEPPAA